MSTPSSSHGLTAARSGVYTTPQHIDAVHSIAGHALWIDIDVASVRTKADLMEAFAGALALPEPFGCNWDALADALADLSWRPAEGYVLRVVRAAGAARALGAEWATLIEVLRHVADVRRGEGVPFIVFVDDVSELPAWI